MASFIFRLGLTPCFVQPSAFVRSPLALSARRIALQASAPQWPVRAFRSLPWLLAATGVAGAGLGASSLGSPSTLHCDGPSPSHGSPSLPPPPRSSVNVYELTFGTICGLCAGIFIKKSARMAAFILGGLFVVLQYLGSISLIKVDWAEMGSRFENLFYTTDAAGNKKPPNVWSIWRWVVDFLTADFQPRASFVAGLALGLRVG